ncbi:beta-propeller fold lactonase family protein [Acuticoccus sp. MNP-M23]|uniref:lactonase family protein n=1 Tax=Acuticoccus sp. MNP-M23 TaxID=3072793 RepID=UPI002815A0DF|nr:beta-propeller fold lactonase family protein [Acuticoccus sp. MNP-M23]WMS43797.1 beta-propeller fold lactonase family protein [Acuticoccus sp. MNP-M23]
MASQQTTQPHETDLLVIALSGEGALALCDFDTATGALTLRGKVGLPGVEGGCGGMPMAADAAKRHVYVAWRGEDPQLFSFALDRESRELGFVATSSLPASMCWLSMASCGERLLTASFPGSAIAISPVGAGGDAGEPIMADQAMHAHCLVEAPNGLVYTASLRGDFIQIYAFDDTRSALRPVARQDVPAGSGPRHIAFTADGSFAYLVSEFAGRVTRFAVSPDTGALTAEQSVDLLPKGQDAWAAEVRLAPAEAVLYVSERNSSQIFGFGLDGHREIRPICAEPAPECPRAFGFDASGRYLVVLGEESGEARTYRMQPDGALEAASQLEVGKGPSWILPV